jgi:hypothetical protein
MESYCVILHRVGKGKGITLGGNTWYHCELETGPASRAEPKHLRHSSLLLPLD